MGARNVNVLSFLNDLRNAKIHYRLSQQGDDTITVEVAVPGERWEVEFLDDGAVEAEVFRGDGNIMDGSALGEILRKHGDVRARFTCHT